MQIFCTFSNNFEDLRACSAVVKHSQTCVCKRLRTLPNKFMIIRCLLPFWWRPLLPLFLDAMCNHCLGGGPSNMLAVRTTEPHCPTSGKVGPCPHPELCDNRRAEFNFCSKALDPGDLWERASFNIALRKRTASQPFSPEQHVKEEGPRLEPHQLSRALAGTHGSVGAEMEHRTPVARLATAQRGPQSHQHECKAI